ncbi:hypothetical protein GGS21DRAFT_491896 [Xylaria nigripes]|nr:hypothetical protein GGS21DRAFT_491896 [Xylaria nigripes]
MSTLSVVLRELAEVTQVIYDSDLPTAAATTAPDAGNLSEATMKGITAGALVLFLASIVLACVVAYKYRIWNLTNAS